MTNPQPLGSDEPLAHAVITAIHGGDFASLRRLLDTHPELANRHIANADRNGVPRTPVLVAVDWPGHFPNVAATIATLAAAGADVNIHLPPHPHFPDCMETPLHQAASSNDVAALDALLDAGADINARGAIFTGGGPLSDAVVFANWDAARRLVERGATVEWWQGAALGLLDIVQRRWQEPPAPTRAEITRSFWHACRAGQRATAEYLLLPVPTRIGLAGITRRRYVPHKTATTRSLSRGCTRAPEPMTTPAEKIIAATGDGVWRMEVVPAWGGVLNSLQYAGASQESLELLAGHKDDKAFAKDRLYHNVPLWPWANRLADGRYTHLGVEYQLPVNEPSTQTALHGFLFRLPVTKVEQTFSLHDAAITLRYDYAGDNPGYPFAARVQVRYAVHRDGLTLTFGVRNNHSAPVPVGVGWHPYFSLGEPVDKLVMQLPPVQRVRINKRMLPTGKTEKFEGFLQSQRIGELNLDTCFALDAGPGLNVGTRLWSARRGLGLELWQRRADYPFIQVFIPPDRRSIALEPVSCGIDAFNTGAGLRLLAPGKSLTAQCGVRMFTTVPQ